jgi:hypothetical protein
MGEARDGLEIARPSLQADDATVFYLLPFGCRAAFVPVLALFKLFLRSVVKSRRTTAAPLCPGPTRDFSQLLATTSEANHLPSRLISVDIRRFVS